MTGGVQLFEEIDQGVSNSRIFLACVSNSYGSSENCRREVLLASDRKKLIVPTIVGQTDPYPPKGSLGSQFLLFLLFTFLPFFNFFFQKLKLHLYLLFHDHIRSFTCRKTLY